MNGYEANWQGALPSGGGVSTSALATDLTIQNFRKGISSGDINEFVTSDPIDYDTFFTKFEILAARAQTRTLTNIEYYIKTPDPFALYDLHLVLKLELRLKAGAEAGVAVKCIDDNIVDNLFTSNTFRIASGQENRSKAIPISILTKAKRLCHLESTTFDQEGEWKYGDTSKLGDFTPGTNLPSVFEVTVPLWMLDGTGLFGLGKQFPPNLIMTLVLEMQTNMNKIFRRSDRRNNVNLNDFYELVIAEEYLRIRTTTLHPDVQQSDAQALTSIKQLLADGARNSGQNINMSDITDGVALSDTLKTMNPNALNDGGLVSLMSTPIHMFATNEFTISTRTLGLPATYSALFDIVREDQQLLQQQTIPKSILFTIRLNLRKPSVQDMTATPLPLAYFRKIKLSELNPVPIVGDPLAGPDTGIEFNRLGPPILSCNSKLDSRRQQQDDHSLMPVQYLSTKQALGRENVSLYKHQDELPLLMGLTVNKSGSFQYETSTQNAILNLEFAYIPARCTRPNVILYDETALRVGTVGGTPDASHFAYATDSPGFPHCINSVHLIVTKIYTQQINIDLSGYTVFLRSNQ